MLLCICMFMAVAGGCGKVLSVGWVGAVTDVCQGAAVDSDDEHGGLAACEAVSFGARGTQTASSRLTHGELTSLCFNRTAATMNELARRHQWTSKGAIDRCPAVDIVEVCAAPLQRMAPAAASCRSLDAAMHVDTVKWDETQQEVAVVLAEPTQSAEGFATQRKVQVMSAIAYFKTSAREAPYPWVFSDDA